MGPVCKDDLTGQILDRVLVWAARKKELDFFEAKGVWAKRVMDEARRNEEHRDYYNTELGILELEEDDIILDVDNWEDVMIQVVLDSGACRHVMAQEDAPVDHAHESNLSRRGLVLVVGNGERF